MLPAEEDVTEGMQEGQNELEQAETSETNVEREISTTEPLNVPETVEGQLLEGAQRGTPTTTAPFAHRLLSARSHLAPFSFPQVRSVIINFVKTEMPKYKLLSMHLQVMLLLFCTPNLQPLPQEAFA